MQKQRIEQLQRERRKVLEENNLEHQPRFFRYYIISNVLPCIAILIIDLVLTCHKAGSIFFPGSSTVLIFLLGECRTSRCS